MADFTGPMEHESVEHGDRSNYHRTTLESIRSRARPRVDARVDIPAAINIVGAVYLTDVPRTDVTARSKFYGGVGGAITSIRC